MNNLELEASPAGVALSTPDTQSHSNLRPRRMINATILWNISWTILLIGTQLVATSAALFWAVVTLLDLPVWMQVIFGLIVFLPTIWAFLMVIRLAIEAETNPANQVEEL
jgi:hypothetical protein